MQIVKVAFAFGLVVISSAGAQEVPAGATYGPIKPGETTWSIALKMRPDNSVTMNQMLVAIYDSNRKSFSGDLNSLLEGSILVAPSIELARATDIYAAKAKAESLGMPERALSPSEQAEAAALRSGVASGPDPASSPGSKSGAAAASTPEMSSTSSAAAGDGAVQTGNVSPPASTVTNRLGPAAASSATAGTSTEPVRAGQVNADPSSPIAVVPLTSDEPAPSVNTPPDAAKGAAEAAGLSVPPVKGRGVPEEQVPTIVVKGFLVNGVGDHPKLGITAAAIQELADADYRALTAATGDATKLTFAQMQGVADKITDRYKQAGFIVARAYLPAQTIGPDNVIRIEVLEGAIGKVIVKGAKRYRPGVIAEPAEQLKGKPLLKDDVDTALLYARDLPGLSVAATFQPGEKTGDTDLVILANEAERPIQVTVGGNDYGTQFTGRYRAQVGVTWNSPLGFGDQFNGKVEYAFDPSNNVYGAIAYRAPIVPLPGFGLLVGATRNELRINNGSVGALDINGPTAAYFGGADWKFVNKVDLQVQAQLLYFYEQSKLDSSDVRLANEKFHVAALKLSVNRTDRKFNGVDLLEVGVRKSLADESGTPDLVSPGHSSDFVSTSLSYTRLQFLTKSQRLYFKLNGQYTDDALIPLEQFVIGGPDSVRAYPIADALRDRGYYTALEYHVDAPGFGDVPSPFYGRPWRELLEFETFADYAKGYAAGGNRAFGSTDSELSGVGAGVIFRLPRFYQFLFHLQGAVPLSSFNASNGNDYHIYGQFGFTY